MKVAAMRWMLMLWTLCIPTAAQAGDYLSGFGFRITVPDVWLVLTQPEVNASAEIFLADRGGSGLEAVALGLRQMVFDRVQSGELEMFYRRSDGSDVFLDNVNVMTQSADLPNSPSQLRQICRALPSEFSRAFGRPIAMDICEMRERIGRRALYLQFDGAIPGTTTLHYQLQQGLGRTLVFTATAATSNLPRIMSEFEGMISSIRLR